MSGLELSLVARELPLWVESTASLPMRAAVDRRAAMVAADRPVESAMSTGQPTNNPLGGRFVYAAIRRQQSTVSDQSLAANDSPRWSPRSG